MNKPKHLEKWLRFWQLTTLWNHRKQQVWKKDLCWFEECECDCWNIIFARKASLLSWRQTSCHLQSHILINWMPKWIKFWRLTTLWECKIMYDWALWEKCECECWNVLYVRNYCLNRWTTQSCWCLARELSKQRATIHWDARHVDWLKRKRFYNIYKWINQRCNDDSEHNYEVYKHYWWRWIKNLWESYLDFKNDMYDSYLEHCEKYWEENTSIDRIDVNWHYCKENCRRATQQEQSNNKRNSFKNINWVSVEELCDRYWCSRSVVRNNYYKLWRDFLALIDCLENRDKKH